MEHINGESGPEIRTLGSRITGFADNHSKKGVLI